MDISNSINHLETFQTLLRLLKLFEVDWSDNVIGFFNTSDKTHAVTVLASYPERIHSNIKLALESAKGHCPHSINMNIEDIIHNAECL